MDEGAEEAVWEGEIEEKEEEEKTDCIYSVD